MRHFIFLLLAGYFFISCDHLDKLANQGKNKQTGSNAKRDKNYTGLWETHFANGKVKSAINYKNGAKHGTAKNFYENGKVKLEMNYENGKRSGKSLYYYEDGSLYRESNYVNNKLDGVRKTYNKGKLKSEVSYKNGEPGIGLKEYLVNGKLKTNYPKIQVRAMDKRYTEGAYVLDIYFSDSHVKDKFYIGQLKEGKYVHAGLEEVFTDKGHGTYRIILPPGAFLMKTLNIVGVHQTKQGNPYVTTRTYNLSIE